MNKLYFILFASHIAICNCLLSEDASCLGWGVISSVNIQSLSPLNVNTQNDSLKQSRNNSYEYSIKYDRIWGLPYGITGILYRNTPINEKNCDIDISNHTIGISVADLFWFFRPRMWVILNYNSFNIGSSSNSSVYGIGYRFEFDMNSLMVNSNKTMFYIPLFLAYTEFAVGDNGYTDSQWGAELFWFYRTDYLYYVLSIKMFERSITSDDFDIYFRSVLGVGFSVRYYIFSNGQNHIKLPL